MEEQVSILYKSWGREIATWQVIIPRCLRFGSSPPHHVEDQWLLEAEHIVTEEMRTYAMKDIYKWNSHCNSNELPLE